MVETPVTQFHLQDESHYNYLTQKLKELYDNNLFTNTLIKSQSGSCEKLVHFTILPLLLDPKIISKYAQKVTKTDKIRKIVCLPFESHLMNNLIDVLYTGKTQLNHQYFPEFNVAVNDLKLPLSVNDYSGFIELSIPDRSNHYLEELWNMKITNYECDLLFLSSEFQFVSSHAEIISAQSKQLIEMNNSRIHKTRPMVVVLQNIPKDDIESVIEFCYKGECKIDKSRMSTIKKVAKLLSIENLLLALNCSEALNDDNIQIERPPSKPRAIIVELIKSNPNYGYCYIWHENKCIMVHAVIMKTFCPFFAKVYELIDYEEKDVAVVINNFNYTEIKAIIDFIYMGQANLVVDEYGISKELIHWLGIAAPGNLMLFKTQPEQEQESESKEGKNGKNADDREIIQCSNCPKQFKSPRTYNNHYKKRHEAPEIFRCETCDKIFLKKSNLKRHENIHKSPEYQCEKCGKLYGNKDYLEEHCRSHTGEKPFICSICFKHFAGRTGLNHHIKVHDKTRNDLHECEICGKEFSRQGLWGHIRTHKKEYVCNFCTDKCFATPSALKRHNKWVHEKHPLLKCQFCGNEFELKSLLQRHLINEHKYSNGEFITRKAYACDKCSHSFHTYPKLQKHLTAKHADKPLLPCQFCGKLLSGSSTTKYHMRSHTGEKPHTCTFCSKSFTRPDLLKKHIRLHTGERFVCSLCKKSFTSEHYLTEHSWTHNEGITLNK